MPGGKHGNSYYDEDDLDYDEDEDEYEEYHEEPTQTAALHHQSRAPPVSQAATRVGKNEAAASP